MILRQHKHGFLRNPLNQLSTEEMKEDGHKLLMTILICKCNNKSLLITLDLHLPLYAIHLIAIYNMYQLTYTTIKMLIKLKK